MPTVQSVVRIIITLLVLWVIYLVLSTLISGLFLQIATVVLVCAGGLVVARELGT